MTTDPTHHPDPPRTCLGCRYMLEGLAATTPGVCPECSRPFDFREPRSTGPKQWHPMWLLAQSSPPLFAFIPFCCILCVPLILWSSPTGYTSDGPTWLIVVGTFGFVVLWSVLFVLSILSRMIVRPRDGKFLRWLWRWWRFPLAFALVAFLQTNGVVWQVRWWHARDGFNDLRAEIAAGKPIPAVPFDIGTLTVTSVEIRPTSPGFSSNLVFILGWPDTAYSGRVPALVSTPNGGVSGWPIDHSLGDNWFHCMDPT